MHHCNNDKLDYNKLSDEERQQIKEQLLKENLLMKPITWNEIKNQNYRQIATSITKISTIKPITEENEDEKNNEIITSEAISPTIEAIKIPIHSITKQENNKKSTISTKSKSKDNNNSSNKLFSYPFTITLSIISLGLCIIYVKKPKSSKKESTPEHKLKEETIR